MIITRGVFQVSIQFPPTFEVSMANRIIPYGTRHRGETAGGACPYIPFPIGGGSPEVISGATGKTSEGFS